MSGKKSDFWSGKSGSTLQYMGVATPEMLQELYNSYGVQQQQAYENMCQDENLPDSEKCYHCMENPAAPGYGGLCYDCPKLVYADEPVTLGDHTGETASWENENHGGSGLGDTTGESSDGTDGLDWNRNMFDSY